MVLNVQAAQHSSPPSVLKILHEADPSQVLVAIFLPMISFSLSTHTSLHFPPSSLCFVLRVIDTHQLFVQVTQMDRSGCTPLHRLCQNPQRTTVNRVTTLVDFDHSTLHIGVGDYQPPVKLKPRSGRTMGMKPHQPVAGLESEAGMLPLHYLARQRT